MTLVNLSRAHLHLLKASITLARRAHGLTDEQRRLLIGAHKVLCNALRGEHEQFDHLRAAPRDISADVTADMTVEQLADAWIDEITIENRIKRQTVEHYANNLHYWILPTIGDMTIREATVGALGVDAGPLRHFLDFTRKDRLHALWWLVALRGLRGGEAAALRWSDIDLDKAEITISRARTSAGYQVFEDAPKTDAGIRTIALDKQTVKVLRAHRLRQQQEFERTCLDWCAAGYVFTLSLRTSKPRAPTSRIIIRYSSRTNIPMILNASPKIPAHQVCDEFWHGTTRPPLRPQGRYASHSDRPTDGQPRLVRTPNRSAFDPGDHNGPVGTDTIGQPPADKVIGALAAGMSRTASHHPPAWRTRSAMPRVASSKSTRRTNLTDWVTAAASLSAVSA